MRVTDQRSTEVEELLAHGCLGEFEYEWVEAAEIPDFERRLLCHDRDMTSTLGEAHGGEVMLEVLRASQEGGHYVREVLLRVAGRVVEYGCIEIALEGFSEELRGEILGAERPLGGILNASGMVYQSCPVGFLKIPSDGLGGDFLKTMGGGFLFGRYNRLVGNDGMLARIVEILPNKK